MSETAEKGRGGPVVDTLPVELRATKFTVVVACNLENGNLATLCEIAMLLTTVFFLSGANDGSADKKRKQKWALRHQQCSLKYRWSKVDRKFQVGINQAIDERKTTRTLSSIRRQLSETTP